MKTYRVKSIFGPTLQGEGSHAGTCTMFLRFAGCNRWTGLEKDRENSFCKFCDTDFRGGEPMTAEEIVMKLNELSPSVKRVVMTGGEPSLQVDRELMHALRFNGYEVHLETNGSRALGEIAAMFDHITMSPKQSREETKLEWCDDLKILYPLPNSPVTPEAFDTFPTEHRFLQPVMDKDYVGNLRATICRIYGNPRWRLSLQTHKIVGVE